MFASRRRDCHSSRVTKHYPSRIAKSGELSEQLVEKSHKTTVNVSTWLAQRFVGNSAISAEVTTQAMQQTAW
jgi:hypothetical protein